LNKSSNALATPYHQNQPHVQPRKLGYPIVLEHLSHLGFLFFFGVSKEVVMTGTLGTSTPTDPKLETLNVPKMDALDVVLVDLPNEVQVEIG